MKKPVRKKVKSKPLWIYEHDGKKYPVSAEKTKLMFDLLHDEVLISGDERTTMFLFDMMESFRKNKDLNAFFKRRYSWLNMKQPK